MRKIFHRISISHNDVIVVKIFDENKSRCVFHLSKKRSIYINANGGHET